MMKKINTDQVRSSAPFWHARVSQEQLSLPLRTSEPSSGCTATPEADAAYFGYFIDADHRPLDASKKATAELQFVKGASSLSTTPSGSLYHVATARDAAAGGQAPSSATCSTPPRSESPLQSTGPMVRSPSISRKILRAKTRSRTTATCTRWPDSMPSHRVYMPGGSCPQRLSGRKLQIYPTVAASE